METKISGKLGYRIKATKEEHSPRLPCGETSKDGDLKGENNATPTHIP